MLDRIVGERQSSHLPTRSRPKAISLVIPCFNEESAIAGTVTRATATLAKLDLEGFEVVVVDDGSTDASASIAEDAGARVIRHPHNAGYGRSLKNGIIAASHDTIVIVDADGTYPVEEVAVALRVYDRGFDMVVGSRTGRHYNPSLLMALFRRLLKFLVEFSAGRKIADVNSGFRVFSRSAVMEYFPRLCDTYSFSTSLTLAYAMTSRFIYHLPINYCARIGHSKVRFGRDSLRTLQFIIEAILYYNPIKIFILLSLVVSSVGAAGLAMAFLLGSVSALYIGSGAVLVGAIIMSIGFATVVLSKILTG